MINGNPAIVNHGNPDLYITAQVLMWKVKANENIRVNLVSLKRSDLQLIKIAESITL